MDSKAIDQLLSEVKDSSSRSLTLAPAECAEVVQAKRVSNNDWLLTLEGAPSLADRLEAFIEAARTLPRPPAEPLGRGDVTTSG